MISQRSQGGEAMNRGQRIVFFAAAVFLIGAFMPWRVVTFPSGVAANRNALSLQNGLVIAGIGLLAVITSLIYRGVPGKMYSLPLVILSGAGAALISLVATQGARFAGQLEAGSAVGLGAGMLVSFVGTLGILFGAMQRVAPATKSK
jgi:hypothetical protein